MPDETAATSKPISAERLTEAARRPSLATLTDEEREANATWLLRIARTKKISPIRTAAWDARNSIFNVKKFTFLFANL